MKKKALIILHPGFEEIEAVTPIDLLDRAGIDVVQAAIGPDLPVEGRSGITVLATHRLHEVCGDAFDAIILPGGPGIIQIRNHPDLCALFQRQLASGKLLACICAAPLLLLDAGLLLNLSYTAHPSITHELPDASPEPVVQDGNIITSRGAGTATEFALALVRNLTDAPTTQSIADAIGWAHSI